MLHIGIRMKYTFDIQLQIQGETDQYYYIWTGFSPLSLESTRPSKSNETPISFKVKERISSNTILIILRRVHDDRPGKGSPYKFPN